MVGGGGGGSSLQFSSMNAWKVLLNSYTFDLI